MKFYKLVEIDEREYIAKTDDYAFEESVTTVIPGEDGIYVAVNEECEDYIMINIEDISETENSEEE